MRQTLSVFSVLIALCVAASPAVALDADNPFGASAPTVLNVPSGGSALLPVTYSILDHNWFLYRDMSSVEITTEDSPLVVSSGEFPKGLVKFDKVSEREREIFADNFVVGVTVEAPEGLADGAYEIVLGARWQGCNKPENYCLFPKSLELPVRVIVGAPAATDGSTEELVGSEPGEGGTTVGVTEGDETTGTSASGRTVLLDGPPASDNCAGTAGTKGGAANGVIDRALAVLKSNAALGTGDGSSSGAGPAGPSLLFLLLVFLGGIASSYTPCVYPMIPITVSVIGANADQGRGKAFLLSCVYVGGIAATYTVMGLAAAKTGGMFGAALQNPLVLLGVAGMMLGLAGAMLGLYEFALPSGLTTRASMIGGGGGFGAAFVVGTVAGIVAAPCTGPVVAYLLLEIAQNGWGTMSGGVVMLSYSLGLGMLFLVIGTFAGVLASMPRSGTWMVTVKKLFGVILLGATAYYLGQALDVWDAEADGGLDWIEPAKTSLWAGVIAAGAWLAAAGKRTPRRIAAALVILGVGGFQLFAPEDHVEGVVWASDLDEELAAASQSGKPVIIDFTADWCAACKELEHFTYTDPAVIQCSTDFERVMLDMTATTDANTALQKRYAVKGLPAVFFVCPDGEVLNSLTLQGFEPADRFLSKMNAALRTCSGD